jgi:hypothetical protein
MLNVGFTVGPNIGAAQPWGRSAGRSECGLIVHLPRWAVALRVEDQQQVQSLSLERVEYSPILPTLLPYFPLLRAPVAPAAAPPYYPDVSSIRGHRFGNALPISLLLAQQKYYYIGYI